MATRKRKQVWDRAAPREAKHAHLSSAKKKSAKAAAKRAGRPYPNLVDNMRAAKQQSAGKKSGKKKSAKKKPAKKSVKKKSASGAPARKTGAGKAVTRKKK